MRKFRKFYNLKKWSKGGGRNFERTNVERPIFRNFKIANVKSYERPSYSIFLFAKLLLFFFNSLNTQNWVSFQF